MMSHFLEVNVKSERSGSKPVLVTAGVSRRC